MDYVDAEYIGSFPSESKCPASENPEYAFIGRSNVGKSSLINLLTGRKALAKVSKKPGKTQMLNFFLINESWYLVDLPGYGFAHTSKSNRRKWEKMIHGYLQKRKTLACTFILIDSNVPPQKIDMEFMEWMAMVQVPFVIVYTKIDRLKPMEKIKNIAAIKDEMLISWNALPEQFITSSIQKEGKEEILSFIENLNREIANFKLQKQD